MCHTIILVITRLRNTRGDFVSSRAPRQYKVYVLESRGRVVTRWPGSQEVGGSISGCATKFVRCKNLAFNIGECVSRGSDTT